MRRGEIVDGTDSPYAMPYENNRPIFICRGLRVAITGPGERYKRHL